MMAQEGGAKVLEHELIWVRSPQGNWVLLPACLGAGEGRLGVPQAMAQQYQLAGTVAFSIGGMEFTAEVEQLEAEPEGMEPARLLLQVPLADIAPRLHANGIDVAA